MTHIIQFSKDTNKPKVQQSSHLNMAGTIYGKPGKIPASLLKYYSIIKQEIRGHPSINWLVSIVLFR